MSRQGVQGFHCIFVQGCARACRETLQHCACALFACAVNFWSPASRECGWKIRTGHSWPLEGERVKAGLRRIRGSGVVGGYRGSWGVCENKELLRKRG